MEAKLFELLVGIKKSTQDVSRKVYEFVPMQDFTKSSDMIRVSLLMNSYMKKMI